MFILYKITDNSSYYQPDSKEALFVSQSQDRLQREIYNLDYMKNNNNSQKCSFEIDEIEEI